MRHLSEAHRDDVEREEVPIHALPARGVAARVLMPLCGLLDSLNAQGIRLNPSLSNVKGPGEESTRTITFASLVAFGSVKICTKSFDSLETCSGKQVTTQHIRQICPRDVPSGWFRCALH